MDRSSDKEKSTKRTGEDRDRGTGKDHHRDRDHKHRHRSGDRDRDDPKRRSERESKPRDERFHDRHKKSRHRERSHDNDDDERDGGRDRELSHETKHREAKREYDVEYEYEGRNKRKEREESEERVVDINNNNGNNNNNNDSREEKKRIRVSKEGGEERRERRRFGDKAKQEEDNKDLVNYVNGAVVNGAGGCSIENGATLEPSTMASRIVPESSLAPGHSPPTKVSSISTTNENKGVNITRSHEVPGKSSTDGTSSAAGKSGNLSLDAIAKAKKTMQMQKELLEKLKKIPLVASSSSDGSLLTVQKEGFKALPSGTGTVQGSVLSMNAPSAVTTGSIPTSSTLPAAAVAPVKPPSSGVPGVTGLTTVPFEAVKRAQEVAAKMGFHQDPEFAPLINLFPGAASDVSAPQKPTKAPVLLVDALGREIDEHGNVVNITKPSNLSTLKVNINKQKKDAFQILKPELDVDPESNPHFDERMGINKTKLLRPKRMAFQFVDEGKWSRDAEIIKLKSQFGEAGAKEQKAKQAQLAKAKAAPDINPNLIEVSERVITKEKLKEPIPEIEWWDVPILFSGSYGEIYDGTMNQDNLKMEKLTIYVEHPRPIEPPAEPAPPPPQPLKLTKKEQKKLRTQRRLAREKDKQEMIRQGLIELPKQKIKMSNLMKVLGSEATQDPTKLEMEIRSAAAEREQAHVDRNIARKLTPAERREKKERKLFDDPNKPETIVSVYRINDLSYSKTRFKVDANARQNRLTGCAVISEGISVVVAEGGSKSIKRYGKLMLRRINWAEAADEEDEEDEDGEKPVNKCALVWQGSVAKPSFHRFSVHECMTEAAAKKVFTDAGVAHYWDLAVNFIDD
ncbi:DUF1115 domain-containing protein/PRP3 domain-containing protein [Cephalotus follicularis]|uniref:DUF1115 domain-containing protein/PRP3 domain-containing protein n=1 Tax=Cephalotus follicularis TaxID=3775 RepID=A0A1Q3CAZ5_CEPFO|nr:DUF1115 domain-containing protein/PRP3 domain-containing protein [Cephalotus follicularis]